MSFKSPKDTVSAVEGIGCTKANLSWDKLLILGFLAGAFIAFGGFLAIIVGKGVPNLDPGLQKLLFGGVFPVGLMLVVIAGAELFTGNTACVIPAVMSGKARWSGLLRNWVLAYIGNLAGSIFVAYFLAYLTGVFNDAPYLGAVVTIAANKVKPDIFLQLFLKGIGCNWLVCLAVWIGISSDDITGKILGIWWPIMAFVTLGLEHSIANMFFIPLGIFYRANMIMAGLPDVPVVTWGQFFITNLVPVTLGNIIGGSFFVGFIYWWVYGSRAEKK